MSYKVDEFKNLSKWIKVYEYFSPEYIRAIESRRAKPQWYVNKKLLSELDDLRDYFGKPIIIHSGFRTDNPYSQHAMGKAVDFSIKGVDMQEVYDRCLTTMSYGCIGMGHQGDFIHRDIREESRKPGVKSAGAMILYYNSLGRAYFRM